MTMHVLAESVVYKKQTGGFNEDKFIIISSVG